MTKSTRSRAPASNASLLSSPGTHYSTWQPIDLDRARKACEQGAQLFNLPGRYHSEGVVYVAGVKLERGGNYLVSEAIRADLEAEQAQKAALRARFFPGTAPAANQEST